MSKYKRNSWSKKDVRICLTLIRHNPDNLSHAFRKASKKTGISYHSIVNNYYRPNGKIYRFARGRTLFRLDSLGFLGKYTVRFNPQVKNNIIKGQSSL